MDAQSIDAKHPPVGRLSSEPARIEVDDEPYVVARVGGSVLVARDRCPHRGAPLSAGMVEDGCLVCPYHGWRFGADGKVVEIPALGPGASLPPRAKLDLVDVVRGEDGEFHVTTAAADLPKEPGMVMANDDPGLRRGWHPVCRSGELAPGGCVELGLLGQTINLERRTDGSICGAEIFAAVDHIGHVWVAPERPLAGLLDVPELEEPGWCHVPMARVEGSYGIGLLLDNQLDAGHFSFVHRETFGSGSSSALPPYELTRTEWGFETTFAVPISARNDTAVLQQERSLDQHRTMTYRYQAPTGLFLRLDYAEMGGSTGIVFCFTPLDATHARMDVDLYFRRPEGFTDEELTDRLTFETKVISEDMALQDKFDSTDLPIDPTAEIHTRADKAALEMRRILQRMLTRVPFGSADGASAPAR